MPAVLFSGRLCRRATFLAQSAKVKLGNEMNEVAEWIVVLAGCGTPCMNGFHDLVGSDVERVRPAAGDHILHPISIRRCILVDRPEHFVGVNRLWTCSR